MRESLCGEEEPLDEWLAHADSSVNQSASYAYASDSIEPLIELSEAREAAGELVRAAYVSRAVSLRKEIPKHVSIDNLYRAQDLMERANDHTFIELEKDVIVRCMTADMGSERHLKASKRSESFVAGAEESHESLMAEGMVNRTFSIL